MKFKKKLKEDVYLCKKLFYSTVKLMLKFDDLWEKLFCGFLKHNDHVGLNINMGHGKLSSLF